MVITEPDYPKCVICLAPHTSNYDFFLAKLAYWAIGREAGFLMKKEWFFFPLSYLLKSMGGVPVYRSKKMRLVDQLAEEFNRRERFSIAITPEGTRKRNPEWKTGFYHLACKAGVPIALAYIDYAKRTIGIEMSLIPSGDEVADMALIKGYYCNRGAKYPEKFAL